MDNTQIIKKAMGLLGKKGQKDLRKRLGEKKYRALKSKARKGKKLIHRVPLASNQTV